MNKIPYTLFAFPFLLAACGTKEPAETPAVYDPTPYDLKIGDFPTPDLPADNILTNAGVQLGRMLFYEKCFRKTAHRPAPTATIRKTLFQTSAALALAWKACRANARLWL